MGIRRWGAQCPYTSIIALTAKPRLTRCVPTRRRILRLPVPSARATTRGVFFRCLPVSARAVAALASQLPDREAGGEADREAGARDALEALVRPAGASWLLRLT